MTKRASVIAVLVALIIGGVTCVGFAATKVWVYGGYSMLNPSAYNSYMEGQANAHIAWAGGSATVNNLTYAIPYGVDVRFGQSPGFMFSAGFTRFTGKAGYNWVSLLGLYSVQREDTISVTGLLGSVLYSVGNVDFGIGGGYYMTNLQKTLPSDVWGLEYAYTAERNQLGFHVQGGYRYPFSKNIALEVEILYRMLTISNMTFRTHDDLFWVGKTWEHELNLSGINILAGIKIGI